MPNNNHLLSTLFPFIARTAEINPKKKQVYNKADFSLKFTKYFKNVNFKMISSIKLAIKIFQRIGSFFFSNRIYF